MTKPAVLIEEEKGALILTLDRPERRNALDSTMMGELLAAVRRSDGRPILLQANGPTFTAGADLSVLRGITDPDERRRVFAPHAGRIAELIGLVAEELMSPARISVAAIGGPVVGGGNVLAMACDFRLATDAARFWFPEVELGREVGEASVTLLTHLVGPSLAKEMLMLARRFEAVELMRLGLIGRIVSEDDLTRSARALSSRLSGFDPTILGGLKRKIHAEWSSKVTAASWYA